MRSLLLVLPILLIAWTSPDLKQTPGVVDPKCTKELVCKPGYASSVRNVPEFVKRRVCTAYGIKDGCPGPAWEIDHLVSLELCGANDPANLWPQPIGEARVKDRLENSLHRKVCNGSITLEVAQQQLRDWGK